MAFFRPFLTDPFFAPASSLLSPSSSLIFDDEPFFSNTPLYLYDNTPSSRRRGGRNTVRPQQQQLKEQQAGSGDNAQAMVSGNTGSDDKDRSATVASSPSTKQTVLTDNSNNNNDKVVNNRDRQQPRHLSPLSLLTPFNHAASLLSSRAALPSMSVDMMSTDKEYTVHASVPGVAKQDLKVTVEDGVLTIEAERREETKQSRTQQSKSPTSQKQQQSAGSPSPANGQKKDAAPAAQDESQGMDTSEHADEPQYHHVESFYGHVSRSITLPDDCNADGMTAKYEDGVLRIAIPRVHEKRQRATRLEIQ